ncbi:hypothetical protein PUN28_014931 [Cardiocondyla obscurior]|uniref:TIL domain-containing protein n=1 Tax=Cardiocondyla obscurior TaxID=286306 RepID=A0AAW2EYP6_9HYME
MPQVDRAISWTATVNPVPTKWTQPHLMLQCNMGCYCEKGKVKNSDQKCVDPLEC